jgi:hypothetical protein
MNALQCNMMTWQILVTITPEVLQLGRGPTKNQAEVSQDGRDLEEEPRRRSPKTAETWKKNHGGGPPRWWRPKRRTTTEVPQDGRDLGHRPW